MVDNVSVWLVALLLALAAGLATALYLATRSESPTPARGRRTR